MITTYRLHRIIINLRNLNKCPNKTYHEESFQKTSLLLATALMGVTGMQAQKAPQDMDRFIDALMKKMTVEEKIGQLNLPVSGEIVTGQAQNSDVAKRLSKDG